MNADCARPTLLRRLGAAMLKPEAVEPARDKAGRILFVDIAKGLVILCVAWYHFSWCPEWQINLFQMPLFFFLSGLVFSPSATPARFAKRKARALAGPLLVGVIAGIIVSWLLYDFENSRRALAQSFINFHVVGNVPLWFLVSLMWIMAIVYISERFVSSAPWRWTIYIALSAAGFAMARLHIQNSLFAGQAMLSLPFFVIGYRWRNFWLSGRWLTPWVMAVCGAMALAGLWFLPWTNIHQMIFHRWYLPSFLPAMAFIMLIMGFCWTIAGLRFSRVITWLGSATIFVLIFHYLLVPPVESLLNSYVFGPEVGLYGRWLICLAAAIIISFVSVAFGRWLKRFIPFLLP